MTRKLSKTLMVLMAIAMVCSIPVGMAAASELPKLPTIKALEHEFMAGAEQKIFDLINDLRQNPGKYTLKDGTNVATLYNPAPALQKKDIIQQSARYKALYMAAYDDFNHEYTAGPYKGGEMQFFTYEWWGENIAGFSPKLSTPEQCGEKLFNQWLNSSGHLKNMMKEDFQYIGIGVVAAPGSRYKVLGTQQFGSGAEPQLTVTIPNPMSEGGASNNNNNTNTATKQGWVQSGGTWYYRMADGSYPKGWLKVGASWYYMDKSSGAMKTGWVNDGGWYYMDKSSGAMKTGWVSDGGKWYLMAPGGKMATGWQQSGGVWYYMTPSSGAMKTGWHQSGSAWYYLSGSGAMVTGTRVIGSTTHTFDSSGRWLG